MSIILYKTWNIQVRRVINICGPFSKMQKYAYFVKLSEYANMQIASKLIQINYNP